VIPPAFRNFFFFLTALFLTGCASFPQTSKEKLNVEKLTPEHIAKVKDLIANIEPLIQKKDQEGKLPALTFKQLESPLNSKEKRFLRLFQNLQAGEIGVTIPFRGLTEGQFPLTRVNGQKIYVKGKEKILPPQFMPPGIFTTYRFMMNAMENATGKRLFVESAYRSSAYQLYLFVFYLSNHDYSIRETAKWVALPGYSEHGDPEHLALDFINADGINGEENAAKFEALPEYQWLLKNASKFGFVLSYPKNAGTGITFEPWHWRYEGAPQLPH
jgi:hypothetical protein